MVDWNGLFKWSMNHQDGTSESKFTEMSKEDRKWMEDALKQFTFNDTDRLQELCKLLPKPENTAEQLSEMLEEVQDLVELHPRNNFNLCRAGGLTEIIALILGHPDSKVRQLAC